MSKTQRVSISFIVTFVLIVCDQITKYCAQRFLSQTTTIPVLGRFLGLRLLYNPGASLGIGASRTWIISLFAIIACCIFIVCLLCTDSLGWSLTMALALAGAAGNLIDRAIYATGFLNGAVVDFLNYGWSVGNIADVYLTVAAVIAIILMLRSVPFTHATNSTKGADKAKGETDSADKAENAKAEEAAQGGEQKK